MLHARGYYYYYLYPRERAAVVIARRISRVYKCEQSLGRKSFARQCQYGTYAHIMASIVRAREREREKRYWPPWPKIVCLYLCARLGRSRRADVTIYAHNEPRQMNAKPRRGAKIIAITQSAGRKSESHAPICGREIFHENTYARPLCATPPPRVIAVSRKLGRCICALRYNMGVNSRSTCVIARATGMNRR